MSDIFCNFAQYSSLNMEIIDNINKTLKEDMITTLRSGSKVAIAASSFSIYAFQELKEYLQIFYQIWNDSGQLQVVTEQVLDNITNAYKVNSPEFIYFITLYNIFSEFLEDISEDVLPNEATGFKSSVIWNKLYNFQRDAALAIINKLEKYNGCILVDSVGLGKTFTALSVIKYYENRNKSVLVLCPKKLHDNWVTYSFVSVSELNLAIYTPSDFILPSKLEKYTEPREDGRFGNLSRAGRERGIRQLMSINLLKRLESSVNSFRLTLERIRKYIATTIEAIDRIASRQTEVSLSQWRQRFAFRQ